METLSKLQGRSQALAPMALRCVCGESLPLAGSATLAPPQLQIRLSRPGKAPSLSKGLLWWLRGGALWGAGGCLELLFLSKAISTALNK